MCTGVTSIKRGHIPSRYSFCHHVSATSDLYSKKIGIFRPCDPTEEGERAEGEEFTAVTVITTGEREITAQSDIRFLQD